MKKTKTISCLLFAAYVLLMLWLLFGQRMAGRFSGTWTDNYWVDITHKINLIPFRTVAEFWEDLLGSLDVDDVMLNMIGVSIGYSLLAWISKRTHG